MIIWQRLGLGLDSKEIFDKPKTWLFKYKKKKWKISDRIETGIYFNNRPMRVSAKNEMCLVFKLYASGVSSR